MQYGMLFCCTDALPYGSGMHQTKCASLRIVDETFSLVVLGRNVKLVMVSM
jgi:hypothetical protein